MTRKRTTKTTIEAHEVYIVKTARRFRPFCAQCAEPAPMISIDEAVRIAGAGSRTLHRWVEAGELHFVETSEGLVFLCPASLLKHIPSQTNSVAR